MFAALYLRSLSTGHDRKCEQQDCQKLVSKHPVATVAFNVDGFFARKVFSRSPTNSTRHESDFGGSWHRREFAGGVDPAATHRFIGVNQ